MSFFYKNRRNYYYKYGTFFNLATAMQKAKYYKRKLGAKYKIVEENYGGQKAYCLYLTKVVRY